MKLTKSKLKQIIKEELESRQKEVVEARGIRRDPERAARIRAKMQMVKDDDLERARHMQKMGYDTDPISGLPVSHFTAPSGEPGGAGDLRADIQQLYDQWGQPETDEGKLYKDQLGELIGLRPGL